MPKRHVVFLKNHHYHIYNRGVAKQDIFTSDRDRERFLEKARHYSKKFSIRILVYCLMPNHFHFLLRQEGDFSVAEFMRHLLVAYSMYFNKKYERVGPVFQNRFKAIYIETDAYLLQLMRYIHQNPFSKTGSRKAETRSLSEYRWSSYPVYLGERRDDFVETTTILGYFSKVLPKDDLREFVETPLIKEEWENLKHLALETGS